MKQNKESNKTHQKLYLNFFINDPRKPNLYYQPSINNDSHNQDLNTKSIKMKKKNEKKSREKRKRKISLLDKE